MDTLVYISELERALDLTKAKLDAANEQLAIKTFQVHVLALTLRNIETNGQGRN